MPYRELSSDHSPMFMKTTGATPAADRIVDTGISHFALKRVLSFIDTRAVCSEVPQAACFFGDIDSSQFRDIYEFSVKFQCESVKHALDTLISDRMKEIKSISEQRGDHYDDYGYHRTPPHISTADRDRLIQLLTSVPLPLLGIPQVAEALRPEWRLHFLASAFDDTVKLSPHPQLDVEGFPAKFKALITVRQ